MLETIMVPLDGSDFARRAVPRAVSLARRADAALLLARVHRGFPPADPGQAPTSLVEADRALERSEREELEAAAEELRGRGLKVETAFEDGPVREALLELAEKEADLVVMSTHGRGGVSRLWLGSVADDLARACSVPLLFLRPEEEQEPDAEEAPDFERVLVPLDGSRLADQALTWATEVGALYGASYTLVRVVVPVMLPGYGYGDLPKGVDAAAREVMEETARNHLERVAAGLRERGLTVELEVVRHTSVPEALLEVAEERGADLLAMATHGRGGVKRMVLGSVADKALRSSRKPLLLCRPDADG